MTGKSLRKKNIKELLLICYMLKEMNTYHVSIFKAQMK